MARAPFVKLPGDGSNRLTGPNPELTQAFAQAQDRKKVGRRPQPVTAPTSGTPIGVNGGGSSGLLSIPSGILKGQGGALFAAVAQEDYEAWLGDPLVDGYILSSTAAGVRSWIIAPTGGGGGGLWGPIKYTLNYTQVSTGSTGFTYPLFMLPAGYCIHFTKIKHLTYWRGGAVSSCTISLGPTGNGTKYAGAFDVWQAPGDTVQQHAALFGGESHVAGTTINANVNSTGAGLNALTTGSAEIWVWMTQAT